MKTLIIILLACFTCGNVIIAQQKGDAPAAVKSAFAKYYPTATKVKWDKEGNQYEASFHYKNMEMSVLYNSDASVAETETKIAVYGLPAAVQKAAAAKGKINAAAKIEKADGTTYWEAEVAGKDLYFEENGTQVKDRVQKDEKDEKDEADEKD